MPSVRLASHCASTANALLQIIWKPVADALAKEGYQVALYDVSYAFTATKIC